MGLRLGPQICISNMFLDLPGGSEVKNLFANVGGGNGNPLQCSCLEGYSPWGHKELDTTELLNSNKFPGDTDATTWEAHAGCSTEWNQSEFS